MTLIGPSTRVRQLFWQKITERLASEGEPAALGKSASGPVYYTDYDDVEHKNRVWFRKGANKEVLGVARADNQGLPNVPDLPIRVARRFGTDVVVGWQRENEEADTSKVKVSANDTTAAYLLSKLAGGTNVTLTETNDGGNETITIAASGGGGGGAANEYSFAAGDFGPASEDTPGSLDMASFGNPLYTPVWVLPDAVNNSIGTSFASAVSGTSVEVYVYWFVHLSATGNWRLTTAVDAEASGERLSNYLGGTTQSEDLANNASDHWELVITKHTHTIDVTAADHVRVTVVRSGSHANDTMTDDVNILGARVIIPDGAGGSTATGVHKFSPPEIRASSNATEEDVTTFTPYIEMPDAVTSSAIVAFIADKTSATLDITIYAVSASSSGDVVLDADAFAGATDGTGTPTDINGFVDSAAFTQDGSIQQHDITVSFTGQDPLAAGDYCSVRIQRLGGATSPADTMTADLRVLMVVVTENGDG